MSPSRRPGLSGRKAQERASCGGERLALGDYGGIGEVTNHEEGGNNPVHEDAEPELHPDGALAEDVVQGLELDLAHHGVHHYEEADG
jgi:hypothetical protein